MTPAELQDALVETLQALFTDYLLPTTAGERRKLNIYKQDLPVPENDGTDEDPDALTVPYIIVRLADGTFDSWNDALHVGVVVIVCTYDSGTDRQGCKDVLSVLTRLFRRFASDQHIGNFTCEVPVEWALQSEVDTYPYYFGAMQMTFTCPGVRIEDPLA